MGVITKALRLGLIKLTAIAIVAHCVQREGVDYKSDRQMFSNSFLLNNALCCIAVVGGRKLYLFFIESFLMAVPVQNSNNSNVPVS